MKNNNPTIALDVSRILDLKGMQAIADISPFIQPIIPIERVTNIIRQQICINSTVGTIYTTPTDKDFYITGGSVSVSKDVTATSLRSFISAQIEGVFRQFSTIQGLTLTAQSETLVFTFKNPVKIDRGTAIYINNTTATGNVSSSGEIYGYTVESKCGS